MFWVVPNTNYNMYSDSHSCPGYACTEYNKTDEQEYLVLSTNIPATIFCPSQQICSTFKNSCSSLFLTCHWYPTLLSTHGSWPHACSERKYNCIRDVKECTLESIVPLFTSVACHFINMYIVLIHNKLKGWTQYYKNHKFW